MKKTNTNILIKTALLAVLLLAFQGISFAQDEEESTPLEISGSVDVYFRANLNASNDSKVAAPAPGSSFANLSGFSLGMANIVLSKSGEKAGFVADLVFGPRGTDAVFDSPRYSTSAQIVNQLYAYWNVGDNTTLTVGNFNTFLGYEVISPTANYNYSTSYMFSYGPFSHTGVKADFTFGDFTAMAALMNATDITEFNADGQYFGGLQFGYGGAYLNFLFDDDYFQADLTAGWDLTDSFYLGVNATTASDNFFGAALYLQNSFSDAFSMGVRGEYFQLSDMASTDLSDATGISPDNSVIDLTLSANYSVGGLTFIPEFRVDILSDDEFTVDIDDMDVAETSSSLASFVIAAVYAF